MRGTLVRRGVASGSREFRIELHFLNLTGEDTLVAVVIGHRNSAIPTDIDRFGHAGDDLGSRVNITFADLRAVIQNCDRATAVFARGEVELQAMLARGQRLFRYDACLLAWIIGTRRRDGGGVILQVKAPPTEPTAGRQNNAIGAALRHVYIGLDAKGSGEKRSHRQAVQLSARPPEDIVILEAMR